MIEKTTVEFKNYGKCIKLSNGIIEAVATIVIGPRIVYFGFVGGENIMNTSKDEFEPMSNELFDKHFYKGATWNNYEGVILTPAPQPENGLAMKIELVMSETEPTMDVIHRMENIADTE